MERRTAEITERKNLVSAFGGKFRVDNLRIQMTGSDGKIVTFERLMFERGHAAAIMHYDPWQDSVLLINEMRPGVLSAGENPFRLSVVAGMIDPGEDGLKTVFRETPEETGAQLLKAFEIHKGAYVSPGGTSEKIALYAGIIDATTASAVAGKEDENEDILTFNVPFKKLMRMVKKQEVNDLKTLALAQWLEKHRPALQRVYAGIRRQVGPAL